MREYKEFRLADHLFVTSEGDMHDLRRDCWALEPLRYNYARTQRELPLTPAGSIALRAAIRQRFAWPGGYEMIFGTRDGGCLCGTCARAEYRNIAWSRRHDCSDGWLVDQMFLADEWDSSDDLRCDHCGRVIVLMHVDGGE